MSLSQQSTVVNFNQSASSSSSNLIVNNPVEVELPEDQFDTISPNREEPLNQQFQRFLSRFKTLTNSVFNQISTNNQPIQNSNGQALIDQFEANKDYLIKLLEYQIEHDRNLERINQIVLKIEKVKELKILSKIKALDSISKALNKIVRDGEEDRMRFEKIDSLNLTPNQILSYARLIAPYTSAPPAPVQNPTEPNQGYGLDLQDPTLRFLMPFPTEDIIRRGRMGQEMSSSAENFDQVISHSLGETKDADGARPNQPNQNESSYPTIPTRRPNIPPIPTQTSQIDQTDDDVFDLDLNPDL